MAATKKYLKRRAKHDVAHKKPHKDTIARLVKNTLIEKHE